MVIIFIGLAIAAAAAAWGTAVAVPAIINAILAFWSNGVMANYRANPQGAPSWSAAVSMITVLASVVLLIVVLIVR